MYGRLRAVGIGEERYERPDGLRDARLYACPLRLVDHPGNGVDRERSFLAGEIEGATRTVAPSCRCAVSLEQVSNGGSASAECCGGVSIDPVADAAYPARALTADRRELPTKNSVVSRGLFLSFPHSIVSAQHCNQRNPKLMVAFHKALPRHAHPAHPAAPSTRSQVTGCPGSA